MADLTPPSSLLAPITIEHGPYTLVVDPAFGARIIAFSVNGKNCLTTTGPQVGSTFWPSPQDFWGWPPPSVLDSQPYQVSSADDTWVFTSEPCPLTQIVLTKMITPAIQGFSIEYRMYNPIDNAQTVTFAPWEITRIAGGLTFYQAASTPLVQSNLSIEVQGDSFWHHYAPAGLEQNLKLFANNSEGWLANMCNGLLLKKSFPQIAEASVAPGEAEIEIYAHGDPANPYIEIEQQGAYGAIAPGQSTAWAVLWQLKEIDTQAYSREDLLRAVQQLSSVDGEVAC
ncbi:hypothetical protein [Marinagarivorans algicola]|uniref:hypothetical protein n=1 Tax=Marinagarivorans algicola TaxID=1513270 RepID=UPI0006B4DB00|nr:hypothetical protein [Marinagarivorans algicola]